MFRFFLNWNKNQPLHRDQDFVKKTNWRQSTSHHHRVQFLLDASNVEIEALYRYWQNGTDHGGWNGGFWWLDRWIYFGLIQKLLAFAGLIVLSAILPSLFVVLKWQVKNSFTVSCKFTHCFIYGQKHLNPLMFSLPRF